MSDLDMSTVNALSALANANRLQIMRWLADPTAHFEPQTDGDLIEDGVCVGRIVRKSGLSQPTVTNHLKLLETNGLVRAKRIGRWVFYKIEENGLAQLSDTLTKLRRSAE